MMMQVFRQQMYVGTKSDDLIIQGTPVSVGRVRTLEIEGTDVDGVIDIWYMPGLFARCRLTIVGTGYNFDHEYAGGFVGTVITYGGLVWHVFSRRID
jgi:hypothetical protein